MRHSYSMPANAKRLNVQFPFGRVAILLLAITAASTGLTKCGKKDDCPQTADERDHKPSSIAVRDLVVKGRTVDVISQLAMKYHVVTGVYGIPIDGYHEPTIDILIKKGTLGDAFDAITKADPRLEWRQSDGAVHFSTRDFPVAVMDVTVHSFGAESDQRNQVLDRLDDAPEVHAWLLDNKCPPKNNHAVASMGGNDDTTRIYISIRARNLPYSAILDQIAAQSRVYFWSVVRNSDSPCPMYSTWRTE
jgi:hypothetical protein